MYSARGRPYRAGFPHSEICGSTGARPSPQLIAACHVLHRLCAPRHSPNALKTLDPTKSITSRDKLSPSSQRKNETFESGPSAKRPLSPKRNSYQTSIYRPALKEKQDDSRPGKSSSVSRQHSPSQSRMATGPEGLSPHKFRSTLSNNNGQHRP